MIAISIIFIVAAFYIFESGIWNSIFLAIGTTGLAAGVVSVAMEAFLSDVFSESIKERFKEDIKTINTDTDKIISNTSLLSLRIEELIQSLNNFSRDEGLVRECNEAQVKSLHWSSVKPTIPL